MNKLKYEVYKLIKDKCVDCEGNGWTTEHNTHETHKRETGECMECPIQDFCKTCSGRGYKREVN